MRHWPNVRNIGIAPPEFVEAVAVWIDESYTDIQGIIDTNESLIACYYEQKKFIICMDLYSAFLSRTQDIIPYDDPRFFDLLGAAIDNWMKGLDAWELGIEETDEEVEPSVPPIAYKYLISCPVGPSAMVRIRGPPIFPTRKSYDYL